MRTIILFCCVGLFLGCHTDRTYRRAKRGKIDAIVSYVTREHYSLTSKDRFWTCGYPKEFIRKQMVEIARKGMQHPKLNPKQKLQLMDVLAHFGDQAEEVNYFTVLANDSDTYYQAEAQYKLGLYNLKIKQDSVAYNWLKKASDNGSGYASTKLGSIYKKNNELKSLFYYKRACALNDSYDYTRDTTACEFVNSYYKKQGALKDSSELIIYSDILKKIRKSKYYGR